MSSLNVSCDVLVIGAGPAGGSAAFEAALKGLGVIIIEKRREVGRPVRCAEYVPLQVLREISLPTAILVQRVEEMVTHLPEGKKVAIKSPGLIINRDELDKYLVYRATEKGAKLYLETRAISYDGRHVLAKRGDDLISISSRVIIGADGPLSTVGKWMGIVNKEFIKTAQYVMPLKEKRNNTEIYFSKNIPGGYGWVFPKLEVANVGVGVNSKLGITAKQALEYFTKRLLEENIMEPNIIRKTGGLIPAGGVLKLCYGNMILVGDAAGLAHPITGAGNWSAILSGKIAAQIACQGIIENNLKILSEYETECHDYFFDILANAYQKKRFLEPYWHKENKELTMAIKKSWIAFREYYE